jgi:hypothetical protein
MNRTGRRPLPPHSRSSFDLSIRSARCRTRRGERQGRMGGAGAVSSQVVHGATRGIHRRPTTTLSTWGECQRIGTEALEAGHDGVVRRPAVGRGTELLTHAPVRSGRAPGRSQGTSSPTGIGTRRVAVPAEVWTASSRPGGAAPRSATRWVIELHITTGQRRAARWHAPGRPRG